MKPWPALRVSLGKQSASPYGASHAFLRPGRGNAELGPDAITNVFCRKRLTVSRWPSRASGSPSAAFRKLDMDVPHRGVWQDCFPGETAKPRAPDPRRTAGRRVRARLALPFRILPTKHRACRNDGLAMNFGERHLLPFRHPREPRSGRRSVQIGRHRASRNDDGSSWQPFLLCG